MATINPPQKGLSVVDRDETRAAPLPNPTLANQGKYRRGAHVGDSLEQRGANTFFALGGWVRAVKTITANAAGFLIVELGTNATYANANTIPVGQRVRFDSDAAVYAGIRGRWFEQTFIGSDTYRLTVPTDALDYGNLVECVKNASAYSNPTLLANGTEALLQIDAIKGNAGSLSETMYRLDQPLDEVVNLGIPGARAGGTSRTDLRAVVDSLNMDSLHFLSITAGINDMANGLPVADAIAGVLYAAKKAVAAGLVVSIDEVHPQAPMTPDKHAFARSFNQALRDYVNTQSKVVLVPAFSIVYDPTTDAGATADLIDGTHLTAGAQVRKGAARARLLEPLLKRRTGSVMPLGATNYLTNGAMSGAVAASNPNTFGVVATGWALSRPASDANAVITAGKQKGAPTMYRPAKNYELGDVVFPTTKTGLWYRCTTAGQAGAAAPTWGQIAWGTTADNTVTWTAVLPMPNLESRSEWLVIQNSVAGTVGAQERFQLTQDVNLATVGLAVGDWIRTGARIHMLDSNWRSFSFGVRGTSTTGSSFAWAVDGAKNALLDPAAQPASEAAGVRCTDWWQIPAGLTSLTVFFEGAHGNAVSANSVMRAYITDAFLQKKP